MTYRKSALRVRLIFWSSLVVFAAATLYLVPELSFYFFFQRTVLAIEARQGDRALLGTRGERVSEPVAEAGTPDVPWRAVALDGCRVFLPPAAGLSTRREGRTLVAEYGEGTITVERFPRGFVRELFLDAVEATAGSVDAASSRCEEIEEGALLHDLARATTDDFEMGMDPLERSIYAASLVAKMRLWDLAAVDRILLLERDGHRGVYVRGVDGDASLIVCLPAGVFVYRLIGLPVREHRPGHPSWFAPDERAGESR